MSVACGFTPTYNHHYHGLALQHFSFLYCVLSLVVALMLNSSFVSISVALPVPLNSSNDDNNNVNVTSIPSPVNSTTISLTLPTDSNSTQSAVPQDKGIRLLTEENLNGGKKSNMSAIAKNEMKHAAKHLGISLLSSFTGSVVGQALRAGRPTKSFGSEAVAETGNSAAGVGLKVTALTAIDDANTNNTIRTNATSNVILLEPSQRKFNKKKLIKTLAPAIVGGAVAGLAGFGVIALMGGATTPAYMLANAVGAVVWNRTQTAINRHVFGVGLRNKTADTRSRLERVKDTTIGLLPNIAGGLASGFVGGKIIGGLAANPVMAKMGGTAKTIIGEALSGGVGGMLHETTTRAVNTAANNIDTPFTSIMRGDKTRNLIINAPGNPAISGTTFFGGKPDASISSGSIGSSSNAGSGSIAVGNV
jgi:hypothetical protein